MTKHPITLMDSGSFCKLWVYRFIPSLKSALLLHEDGEMVYAAHPWAACRSTAQ